MLDKIDTMKSFSSNLYLSYNFLKSCLESSSGNLILIGVNSPFALEFLSPLFKESKITQPSVEDLDDKGDLGGFLRWQLLRSNNKKCDGLLVLNYFDQLKYSYHDEKTLAYKINSNRDLFRKLYMSTIIVAPINIIAAIRHYAVDFWSCLDLYIDTTKWFCNPVLLPIVQIRTFSNTTAYFVDLYKSDRLTYHNYEILKKEITSSDVYSQKTFHNLLQKINSYEGLCYYDAIYHFVQKMTTNQAKYDNYRRRIIDLRNIHFKGDNHSLVFADLYFMLAEFFFKSGEYEDAYNLYEKCRSIVAEMMIEDCESAFILCMIKCNKEICRYMREGTHSPIELTERLKRFFSHDLQNEYNDFFTTYMLIVSYTVEHHSYAQHQEILLTLNNHKNIFHPNINFEETYFTLVQWEESIASNFTAVNKSLKNKTVLTKIIFYFQKMICYYCLGDYPNSRKYYKIAKQCAKQYGYIQLYDILESTMANMRYMMNYCDK